jgi:hypothetical protein
VIVSRVPQGNCTQTTRTHTRRAAGIAVRKLLARHTHFSWGVATKTSPISQGWNAFLTALTNSPNYQLIFYMN